MSRVLSAIDASPAARAVLAVAPHIASLFDGQIDAVHVLEDGGGTARAAAEETGTPLREREGPVADILIEESAAPDVVAVVLGTRTSHLGRRPAGHVALRLSAVIDKPLVLVPPETGPEWRLGGVLVPLDGTTETSLAMRDLVERACARKLGVCILHVHDEADIPSFHDHPAYEIEARAQEFLARNCPPGVEVRAEMRVGIPAEEILRTAAERRVDLLALGWSRDLSTDRAAVVREALKRALVPVILVPLA